MSYPASTPPQLKAVLRALRKTRGLSQAELGAQIGVNQKRIARIEGDPGVTSFDQVARIVAALGGRIVIDAPDAPDQAKPSTPRRTRPSRQDNSTW